MTYENDVFSNYSAEEIVDFLHYTELLGCCDDKDIELLKKRMDEISWEAKEQKSHGPKK